MKRARTNLKVRLDTLWRLNALNAKPMNFYWDIPEEFPIRCFLSPDLLWVSSARNRHPIRTVDSEIASWFFLFSSQNFVLPLVPWSVLNSRICAASNFCHVRSFHVVCRNFNCVLSKSKCIQLGLGERRHPAAIFYERVKKIRDLGNPRFVL